MRLFSLKNKKIYFYIKKFLPPTKKSTPSSNITVIIKLKIKKIIKLK